MNLSKTKIIKSCGKFLPQNVKNLIKFSIVKFYRFCSLVVYRVMKRPERTALYTIKGGGIILSFDDHHVNDWYNADEVLNKYHWKATFSVSNFTSLDKKDVEKLKILQSKGHEIAAHGNNHLNALEFISSHTIYKYIDTEVLPSLTAMTDQGLKVSSFAYPFGARKKEVDKVLLKYFMMLRGTTYGKKAPSTHNNYANGSRVVFGLGIDQNYGNDINYILRMLRYAKDHNKIAVFYSHHIQQGNPNGYITSYKTLETICQFAIENNMQFMTLKDLAIITDV